MFETVLSPSAFEGREVVSWGFMAEAQTQEVEEVIGMRKHVGRERPWSEMFSTCPAAGCAAAHPSLRQLA